MSRRPARVRPARSGPHGAPTVRRGLLTAALALGWALVPAVVPGAVAPAHGVGTPPAAELEVGPGLPVQIAVEQITPQALAPGQDLTVSLRLTNVGAEVLTQPRVIVRLARSSFISRTSLERWRDAPTTAAAGTSVLEVDLPGPLAPGASADVTGVVPAAAIGLRSTASSWGARGLAVEMVDAADPARLRQGLVRTFLVWLPPQELVPTTVTVLVPVVGPAPGAGSDAELATLTAGGGRLDRVLRATSGQAVTWALDPSLLDRTAPATGAGGGAGAGGAGGAAGDLARWRSDLLAAAPQDVQLLPYGDADVTALAHASAGGLLDTAQDRSAEVAAAAGLSGEPVLRWPGDPLPDLVTASATRRDGLALVVGPGELEPPAILTYTPTGRTTVTTGAGDVPVLIADERLSTGLATGRVGSVEDAAASAEDATPSAQDADPQLTGAVAAADLLAELAVITRERPSDGRHLLLTVPRDWSPDPAVAAAQLAALSVAPWVATAPVAGLVRAEDPEVERGSLPDREVDPAEVSAAEIASVVTTLRARADIASIAADPAALVGDTTTELLAPTALAWRADTAGRTAAIAASVATTRALGSAVAVQRGSDVLLVATSGSLPVRVSNGLDQEVVVQVRLRPGSPQLVADESVTVSVPAGGEVTARVPVHAIQSADVVVAVELRTAAGTLVDDSAVFVVRVRADWEGISAAILGALLAVGLVIGLVRTIRRGRGRRGTPRVDPGPDDLSPEQQSLAPVATTPAEETPT